MMTYRKKFHQMWTISVVTLICHLPLVVFLFQAETPLSELEGLLHASLNLLAVPPLLLLSLLRYQTVKKSKFWEIFASGRLSVVLSLLSQFFLVSFFFSEKTPSTVFELISPVYFLAYLAELRPVKDISTKTNIRFASALFTIIATIMLLTHSWGLIAANIAVPTMALIALSAALVSLFKAIWNNEHKDTVCTIIPYYWLSLTSLMALISNNPFIPMAISSVFLVMVYLATISLLISDAQVIRPEGLVSILSGKQMQQEIARVKQELALQELKSLEFEKQLADSSLLAAATLDNMSAQVCIIDAEGLISATNKSWKEFFSTLHSEMPELLSEGSVFSLGDFSDHNIKPSLERITAGLAYVRDNKSRSFSDIVEYQLGEQKKFFQLKISSFESILGNRYLISQEDVTELKIAEEELQLKNIAIERANDGIVITDPTAHDNPIIYVSQGFLNLTGYQQDEVMGINCRFMQGQKTNPVVVEKMRNAIARGEPFTGELINYKKDGTVWFNRLKLEPIRNSRGELIRYVGVQMDITASKLLEAERKQALERTTKAKQELERLYQEAQNANSVKDDFLATLSHELRTPAGVIVGFTELLKYEDLNASEKEEALDALERNSRALVTLIDDLLDMNRVITGKLKLSPKPVDVTAVVDSVISAELLAAQTKNIRIVTDFDPGAGPVYGDVTRLQQIFWNLLSNAIKFTPRNGRVKVAIRTEGTRLVVRVSDTGVGIDPRFLPHVFERFRQQTEGMSRTYGGLGLGLSIVKHLVELHGGQVYAESAGVGKGATFIVSLPALTTAG